MPHNGRERFVQRTNHVAAQHLRLRDEVHVADPETRAFLLENNVPCLVKPFEVADLITHARRLMQKAHAASAN